MAEFRERIDRIEANEDGRKHARSATLNPNPIKSLLLRRVAMLPAQYRWHQAGPGPRMIIEALKEYGMFEAPSAADNPKIIGWPAELEAAGLGRADAHALRRLEQQRDRRPDCRGGARGGSRDDNRYRHPDRDAATEPVQLMNNGAKAAAYDDLGVYVETDY